MKKLLNTLYVTSENSYLSLDGENIVVFEDKKEVGRLPLHNLEGIVSFGYRGTSPALMGACADRNISLCYVTPQGKFLARVTGKIKGNVILRQQQYESSRDKEISLSIAKNCITGKIYNARWVLERAVRDHSLQILQGMLLPILIPNVLPARNLLHYQQSQFIAGIQEMPGLGIMAGANHIAAQLPAQKLRIPALYPLRHGIAHIGP